MRKYKVYHSQYEGYCAVMKDDGMQFWQQVSHWYTSLNYLNRYWGEKNGIKLPARGFIEY